MGVYYDASIGWGLRVPQTEALYGEDLQDVYEIPPGFGYAMGGDLMNGESMAYLVHPDGAVRKILDTVGYRESGFGIHSVSEVYAPTGEDYAKLVEFAHQYDLDDDIGWFAISSVG